MMRISGGRFLQHLAGHGRSRGIAAGAIGLVLLGWAAAARMPDRDVLWRIVHDQCVPNQQQNDTPAPCSLVALDQGVDRGHAVLKDIRGATQFLLIPTRRVSGIESPELLEPDAPNYFAAAWEARRFVEERAGRSLPRDGISLAINSSLARSQDELHIHVDCLRVDIRDSLREQAANIADRWAPLTVPLAGQRYLAMRVRGASLDGQDPFQLLAAGVPGARQEMGRYTLVAVGMERPGGEPGFVLLAARADAATGHDGWGEILQDHACALAQG